MHTKTWISLENIILNERSQTQKATYCMTPLTLNLQNRTISKDKKWLGVGKSLWGEDTWGVLLNG